MYLTDIWAGLFPNPELQIERITIGTKISGSLESMLFWPTDMKRILKKPISTKNIQIEFNEENLR